MSLHTNPPAPHLAMFGKRIIGEEAAAYFESPQSRPASVFGHRVLGSAPAGATATADSTGGEEGDSNNDGVLSLAEIKDLLQAHPERQDELIARERTQQKPRKGAWRLFAETEEAKPADQRRPELLAELLALAAAT